jgi:hypothetical protein
MPSEATRAYIYRVLLAIIPILTVYGIVDGNDAAVWIGLAGAVLGQGLATANTSTKS